MKCDLRDEDEIIKLFEWIDRKLGAIGILINAAGILLPTTLMGKLD